MVGLWRIEQRKPEQHSKQHPGRPEQVGELASHVANIRLGEILNERYRLFRQAHPDVKTDGPSILWCGMQICGISVGVSQIAVVSKAGRAVCHAYSSVFAMLLGHSGRGRHALLSRVAGASRHQLSTNTAL